MEVTRRDFARLALAATLAPAPAWAMATAPLVFFDGGTPASDAYDRAISQGADFLVAPVVACQDGALIAAPDNELSAFTDIAGRTEFAARHATRTFDGAPVSGWFAEDFTLAEVQSLATGPAPRGHAPAPRLLSLRQVIDIARAGSVRAARVVGVSPRLIRPAYFAARDLALEPRLADLIALNGYNSRAAAMIVQSADPAALKAFGALSRARRVQLAEAGAIDLAGVRAWAEAVGPAESLVVVPAPKGPMVATGLVSAAHSAGLAVFARAAPGAPREPRRAMRARLSALIMAGVDGVMCADVALAVSARGEAMDRASRS